MYTGVVRTISIYALVETNKSIVRAREMVAKRLHRTACSGRSRRVQGRPCVHELVLLLEAGGRLKLTPWYFDSHWHIRLGSVVEARVLEPAPPYERRFAVQRNIEHRASFGLNSVHRDPTYAEMVDMDHLKRSRQ